MSYLIIVLIGLSLFLCPSRIFSQTINILTEPQVLASVPKPTTHSAVPAKQKVYLAIPAGAVAGIEEKSNSAGAKAGLQLWYPQKAFISLMFNYAGTSTVSGEQDVFGTYIRNPGSDSYSFTGSGNIHWPIPGASDIHIGSYFRVGAGLSDWEARIQTESGTAADQRHSAALLYGSVGIQLATREFFWSDSANIYQAGIEAGVTTRLLANSVANKKEFLAQVLGHPGTDFTGLEFTVFLRLNSIVPFVRITTIPLKSDTAIDGLTGTNVFIGIDVLSSVFQSAL